MTKPEPMLDFPDLIDDLKVKPGTARDWLRKGLLPPGIKLGPRTRRWTREEIERFKAERRLG